MKSAHPIDMPTFFPPNLWQGANVLACREPLTALYINHYVGPRHTVEMTSHDFWEMTFVLGGSGTMVFEGHTVVLPTASVLLIPPHMPHTERSDDTDWDTLWIAIRGKTLDKLSSQQPFHLADGQSLLPWAHQMLAWRQQQVGPIGPELDALAAFLLTAVLRLMQQSDPGNCPGWLSEVLAHIHQHLDQPIVMDDLADLASCSLGHFHRQFHQATGETPLHYLARHRMERALQFLRQTQWPVKTIAAKSGFTDPLYFSRCFRKVFGCSPVQARKRMQGQKHR